jgi:hypothetical protein
VRCDKRKLGSEDSPSSIKILEIAMVLALLESSLQVLLYFRNCLQSVWNLESLHIFNQRVIKMSEKALCQITNLEQSWQVYGIC